MHKAGGERFYVNAHYLIPRDRLLLLGHFYHNGRREHYPLLRLAKEEKGDETVQFGLAVQLLERVLHVEDYTHLLRPQLPVQVPLGPICERCFARFSIRLVRLL